MRQVEYKDENGYMRCRLVKDEDSDDMAEMGIPLEPPDINLIDWEEVKRDLHNELMIRGLTSFESVQKQQNGLTGSVLGCLRTRLIRLFREVQTNG